MFPEVVSMIDKLAKNNIIHDNKAANLKSKLTKKVNALAKYELIKSRLTIFGSATNILNEEFVENVGYSTRGRNFKIGLNIII